MDLMHFCWLDWSDWLQEKKKRKDNESRLKNWRNLMIYKCELNGIVFYHLFREDIHFADVTLAVDGHSMKAHRIILCACSSYFQNILRLASFHFICVSLYSNLNVLKLSIPTPLKVFLLFFLDISTFITP